MNDVRYDPSAMEKNNIKRQSFITQSKYFLSFVVVFKAINTSDFLRVFSKNNIIDEVACDSKIKIIDVPIEFQNNIEFEMFSDRNNQCKFYFVSLSQEIKNHYRLKQFKFLYTKTDWHKDTFLEDMAYAGNMFGRQLHGNIAKPDQNRIEFSACLKPTDSPHYDLIWFDSVSSKNYTCTNGLWIAKFRPGYACFYRKNKHQKHNITPHVNVFNSIEFVLEKNLVRCTKSTGKTMDVAIDNIMRVKKITDEEQYLDFIHDALIFYPAVVLNWHDFKL